MKQETGIRIVQCTMILQRDELDLPPPTPASLPSTGLTRGGSKAHRTHCIITSTARQPKRLLATAPELRPVKVLFRNKCLSRSSTAPLTKPLPNPPPHPMSPTEEQGKYTQDILPSPSPLINPLKRFQNWRA